MSPTLGFIQTRGLGYESISWEKAPFPDDIIPCLKNDVSIMIKYKASRFSLLFVKTILGQSRDIIDITQGSFSYGVMHCEQLL